MPIGAVDQSTSRSKYRLLFIVNEDWAFVRQFLLVARAARDAGFEIVVATNVQDHRRQIEAENFRVVQIGGRRGALDPGALIRYLLRFDRSSLPNGPT